MQILRRQYGDITIFSFIGKFDGGRDCVNMKQDFADLLDAGHVPWPLVAADRLDPGLPHHPRDGVTTARLTVLTQILEDPRTAIGTAAFLVELLDYLQQSSIIDRTI